MHKPPHVVEIFLQPGEVYFGERDTRIRTLLGSCVAITVWHPILLVGGMCHYMLPKHRGKKRDELDGRYADEAIELMLREIRSAGTWPHEYQVKMFGGGHMFSRQQTVKEDHIGEQNIESARKLIKLHGFTSCAEHLGGEGHRNILFDIWSGHVWMKHQTPQKTVNKNGTLCPQ